MNRLAQSSKEDIISTWIYCLSISLLASIVLSDRINFNIDIPDIRFDPTYADVISTAQLIIAVILGILGLILAKRLSELAVLSSKENSEREFIKGRLIAGCIQIQASFTLILNHTDSKTPRIERITELLNNRLLLQISILFEHWEHTNTITFHAQKKITHSNEGKIVKAELVSVLESIGKDFRLAINNNDSAAIRVMCWDYINRFENIQLLLAR